MDPARLVLVRIGGVPNGSGYLIGSQLVLTGLHVVCDSAWRFHSGVNVRVGHPVHGPGLRERGAQVCWPDPDSYVPGSSKVDVALLWLDTPVDVGNSALVRWGRPVGTVPVPYEGVGFPSFANSLGDPQVEYLRGDLPPVSTSGPRGGWVLDTPVWPESHGSSPWAGASGSAVFCWGRLVGVVAEADAALGQRRLHAQPVHPLFDDSQFTQLLEWHGGSGAVPALEPVKADQEPERWPVLAGFLPPRASAFQPRTKVCEAINSARERYGTVVLTQVLAGHGGVGKSQLAAHYARQALSEGTDVVVWADATQPASVLGVYANAAVQVQVPGASGKPEDVEQDADRFLAWLATTDRSWLVVLDNVTDQTPGSLWPATSRIGRGRVIATSRMRGSMASNAGRALVEVGVYSDSESADYLRERLEEAECAHLLDSEAANLAQALGHLPLALAYAAAYMIQRRRSTSSYLRLFRDRAKTLEEALPPAHGGVDGYQRPITAALLLSLDAARQEEQLAVPALALASLLDPAGHPRDLWATKPVLKYLTRARAAAARDGSAMASDWNHEPPDWYLAPPAPAGPAGSSGIGRNSEADPVAGDVSAMASDEGYELPDWEPPSWYSATTGPGSFTTRNSQADAVQVDEALDALGILHNYSLITLSEEQNRQVALHALTARATLDTTPAEQRPHHTAADALLAIWPAEDHLNRDLATVLRSSTTTLTAHGADVFWQASDDIHELLVRFGKSLTEAGLHQAAIRHWEQLAPATERVLGSRHTDTLTAYANLASAHGRAGHIAEAITLHQQLLARYERILGPDHPHTLTIYANLANCHWQAGHINNAITIEERLLAHYEQKFGPLHRDTIAARSSLASSYAQAGRTQEANTLTNMVAFASNRLWGHDHPDTITARNDQASALWRARRTEEAIALQKEVVADSERILGPDHPDTIRARDNLFTCYWQAGRADEAIHLQKQALADSERILGPDHPDTITNRSNLALSYQQIGDINQAISLAERALTDGERIIPDHNNTLANRAILATFYRQAGRIREALAMLEQAVAEHARLNHPDTPDLRRLLADWRRTSGWPDPPGRWSP